jgi:hypothetical protein
LLKVFEESSLADKTPEPRVDTTQSTGVHQLNNVFISLRAELNLDWEDTLKLIMLLYFIKLFRILPRWPSKLRITNILSLSSSFPVTQNQNTTILCVIHLTHRNAMTSNIATISLLLVYETLIAFQPLLLSFITFSNLSRNFQFIFLS